MKLRRVAVTFAAISTLIVGCSNSGDPSVQSVTRGRLPAGVVAKVGSEEVAFETVTKIARAQNVTPSVARDLAIHDAAFAAAARAGFADGSVTLVVERAAWARALLETLKAEAAARGAPTDTEVSEVSALRWQDFDRPETVRTTHAVAIVTQPTQDAAARAIAQRVFEAVRGVNDPAEFLRLAQAVPHEGVDVRAERLPAITPDGRVYYPEGAPPDAANQHFDEQFARAAHRLAPGQISEPTKTVFGYHVILCEARLPEQRVPLQERRVLLTDEVLKRRAERSKQELLGRLSSATPILITRSVEDLTAQVQVTE
ncbi:MAG TPA: peptidyl-prolyl cis-trans isomerase [Polyangiaceae bacterium]|nr:peptidyl-prolyl cis-trans isomerase [Polyangiaceae bacterium]